MISVIIPCFNAERYITASIQSILNQTYRNLEVIVLNDSSTDSSLTKILAIKDPRLRIISNSENLGYLKSINILLSEAKGNIIAFQDADDLSDPNRLEMQMDYLNDHLDISIVGTNYSIINESGFLVSSHVVEVDHSNLAEILESRNPFQKPSIAFRKEVYDVIGGFREAFRDLGNISEDYDWLLRSSHTFKFGNINGQTPLYNYRSVASAMTKSVKNIDQLFGHQIAQMLHQERLEFGMDSMDKGDLSGLKEFIKDLRQPYLNDPSKFFRERAETLLYFGLKMQAISYSFRALLARPNLTNARLVQHCIRKSVLGV